jgi:hypothetical protein
MRYLHASILCLALAPSTMALAQAPRESSVVVQDSLATAQPAGTCTKLSIACNQTVQGTLGSGGCTNNVGNPEDFYQFTGTKEEQITATLTTTVFDPSLELRDPNNNQIDSSSQTSPSSVQFSVALPEAGNWVLGATSSGGGATTGAYSLKLTCGAAPPTCESNSTTLCIGNGRFAVKAIYNAGSNGGTGNAQAVALTSDTGYLWFFEASNVEAVVKVIDGCALNNRWWVFAGGLTNVNVVMTVTDTTTNTTKTYTNPANTEFQPIQDTSAFATCP